MKKNILLGPVMGDIPGLELTEADITRLTHPLIGGVILFARNFSSPEQLKALTASIHALREPMLPIAVDHEGGRVQRFLQGFTKIPPMRALGEAWDRDPNAATGLAKDVGYVMGRELHAHGIDFSFAPVLDLDYGESGVIGNRAFHRDHRIVSMLAGHLMRGLAEAGLGNVGKHFPGHGYVKADSHHEVPQDERDLTAISNEDMVPFADLARKGLMKGVMPAHVIYTQVSPMPAGFSAKWLKTILREELGFKGVIYSDDLSMEGASAAGGIVERALAAFNAGCDMVLLCNDQGRCDELLAGLSQRGITANVTQSAHLAQMRATGNLPPLVDDARYLAASLSVASLG